MPLTDLEPVPNPWAKAQHMRSRAESHAVDRHVGLRLAARREDLVLSREDLARQADVPAARLRQFDAGEASIPASEAESIVLSEAVLAIRNRRVRQSFYALVKAVAAREG